MALAKMTFDELNQLVGYKVSEPFDEYFAPMRINKKQISFRINLAEKLDGVFLALLAEYFYAEQMGVIVQSDIFMRTRQQYLDAINETVNLAVVSKCINGKQPTDAELQRQQDEFERFITAHAMSVITHTVDVLTRNRDFEFFYSADRARAIAENDSNTVLNDAELWAAEFGGKFTKKTWHTIMDGRERDSHAEINGTTIPLQDFFYLRGGYLLFPRDNEYGDADDSELSNCRCSLSYS